MPAIELRAGLRSPRALARMLSAAVAAVVLWTRWAPVPFMQEQQIHQALTSIGVLVWPAVVAPWLARRLSVRSRYVFGLLGVILGYWLQGQPMFALTRERVLFNVRLLPYLGGAAVVLIGLVLAVHREAEARRSAWVSVLSLVVALTWTLFSVLPIRAVASMKAETVALPGLTVSETYVLGVPRDSALTGCAFEDVIVICGSEAVLWRFPDGTARTLALSLNHRSLDIVEDNGYVLILDKKSGVLHCFGAATGDQVWRADDLGTINQIRWADDAGWFLDHPEPGEFEPGQGVIRLHRVEFATGCHTVWPLEPPDGMFWPEIPDWTTSDWSGAQLGLCGDSAFVRIVTWVDPASGIPGWSSYLAIPRDGPDELWDFMKVPEGSVPTDHVAEMGMAGGTAIYLCFRNGRYEVVARDIAGGHETWSLVIGGNGYGGRPFAVLPDRVLLDYGSFMESLRTDLVCLDPRTGRETWRFDKPPSGLRSMEAVGSNTLVLIEDAAYPVAPHTSLTLLAENGAPAWSYRAKGPAYTVYVDVGRDRLVLLEGAGEQLPGSGWWGIETTIRLSDGQAEHGKNAGVGEAEPDLGSYRYLLIGDMLYRSAARFTGDYLANQAVMRLDGPGVPIVDPVRYTDNVLARPDMIAVACRIPEGAKIYILMTGE